MAQAARSSEQAPRGPFSLLDTDGRPHPVEDSLAVLTLLLGAVAFGTSLADHLYLTSSWTGLVGVLTGAWGQLISATTAERFVLIIGMGAAAVGFYLGMAHGGLYSGMFG
ncbi:hypothetical protein RKE29_06545 [Streptomyces sp. B1866]|uniref:hypothetical protein n=1 Tax=Streptomyces sp. B1866 TaxID=3075431 RepID=UPI00288DDC55|nr:hypothetical protein [Streptomyces sp. B1866]MDT3396300.1 hypothetical protein [Streptomyces sp. B1866]